MKRYAMLLLFTFPALLLFLASSGQAGGDKASPWKPILSADVYKVLTDRSVKAIEAAAKADARPKIEIEAAILAGYTFSVKNPSDDAVAALRSAALEAGSTAHRNKDIKPLVDFGKLVKSAKVGDKKRKIHLHDVDDLMYVFRGKAKGGEGIHEDLQYQPKLKNLNGIEALIGALATKKLSDTNLDKVGKELVPLAYRVAVIGSITYEVAPDKNADKWRELANHMRDASIAVAESAQKKDGDGILKGALALETSCTQCHMAFKKK